MPAAARNPLRSLRLVACSLACLAAPGTHAEAPPRFRLDLGFAADSFSKNYSDPGYGHHREGTEGAGFLELGYRLAPAITLLAGGDLSSPVGQVDGRFNVGAYFAALETVLLNASIAYAPNRHLVPRWDLTAGLDWQALSWLALLGNVRHLDFPSDSLSGLPSGHDTVTSVSGGLRLSAIPRTTLTVQSGFSHHTGTTSGGGSDSQIPGTGFVSGRVEFAALESLSLSLGGAYGGESRRPFNPQLVSTVASVSGGVRWQFAEAWAVRIDAVREAFDGEYLRNGASTALTVKF